MRRVHQIVVRQEAPVEGNPLTLFEVSWCAARSRIVARQQLIAAEELNCAKTPDGLCAQIHTCMSQWVGMPGK